MDRATGHHPSARARLKAATALWIFAAALPLSPAMAQQQAGAQQGDAQPAGAQQADAQQAVSTASSTDTAAQSAPAASDAAPAASTENQVVITGFRSSLAKAINQKRASAAALDSILAEDIGKFPDLNLSE